MMIPTIFLLLSLVLNLLDVVRTDEISCGAAGIFNDDPPFNEMPLPWCPDAMNPPPSYTMFTRTNRDDGQSFGTSSIPPAFDPERRTVFLVHGYQGSGADGWYFTMKDAFLDREDINVVTVGWEGGAQTINYTQAASNTRSTGAQNALVIENLINNGGGSDTRMWCAGVSLGSHVCGHTGARTTLQRITGMDPAGPAFEDNPDIAVGLNPSCARFVDIIHTDGPVLGTRRDLGHVDFYPNGGELQPGCGEEIGGYCSHARSVPYMENSVRSDCFLAAQSCEDWNDLPGSCSECSCGNLPCSYMGYGADYGCHLTGWFYVNVTDTPPYCQISYTN